MKAALKKRASIRTQIILRFSGVFVILTISCVSLIFSIAKIVTARDHYNEHRISQKSLIQAASDHYRWAFQLVSSIAFNEDFNVSTDPALCDFGKYLYSEYVQTNPEYTEFVKQVEPLHNLIHEGARRILLQTELEEIHRIYTRDIRPNLNTLISIVNEEASHLNAHIEETEDEENEALKNQFITILVQMGFLFVSLFLVFMYVGRHIVEPILKLEKKCLHLAEGDLSQDFVIHCKNSDLQKLGASLNTAVAEIRQYVSDIDRAMEQISQRNLNINVYSDQPFVGDFKPIETSISRMLMDLTRSIQQIEDASQQVSMGSRNVAQGAQALAYGSTEQASSVQELAATVAEVSDQISSNAIHASRAGEMAHNTSEAISASNRQMKQLMVSMQEINTRSEQINNIIKTIEDIAFQTNILALNAAVEAARAGNAGKGFAVVADEVRSLAGKSAEAAQNTTELIESSIRAIRTGVSLAQATAAEMDRVVDTANQTSAFIEEIAHATQEQSNALEQINMGLEHISSVVQSNSATSEQSATASEQLSVQAAQLRDLIGTFTLLEDSTVSSASYT